MILRFPSKEDPDRRDLMFVSSYTFIINEDNQMTLLVQVKDSKGKEVRLDQFLRTDVEDRKYSVTTDKFSRWLDFNLILLLSIKYIFQASKPEAGSPQTWGPKTKHQSDSSFYWGDVKFS